MINPPDPSALTADLDLNKVTEQLYALAAENRQLKANLEAAEQHVKILSETVEALGAKIADRSGLLNQCRIYISSNGTWTPNFRQGILGQLAEVLDKIPVE